MNQGSSRSSHFGNPGCLIERVWNESPTNQCFENRPWNSLQNRQMNEPRAPSSRFGNEGHAIERDRNESPTNRWFEIRPARTLPIRQRRKPRPSARLPENARDWISGRCGPGGQSRRRNHRKQRPGALSSSGDGPAHRHRPRHSGERSWQ
jgi:hypothetical protein